MRFQREVTQNAAALWLGRCLTPDDALRLAGTTKLTSRPTIRPRFTQRREATDNKHLDPKKGLSGNANITRLCASCKDAKCARGRRRGAAL